MKDRFDKEHTLLIRQPLSISIIEFFRVEKVASCIDKRMKVLVNSSAECATCFISTTLADVIGMRLWTIQGSTKSSQGLLINILAGENGTAIILA